MLNMYLTDKKHRILLLYFDFIFEREQNLDKPDNFTPVSKKKE